MSGKKFVRISLILTAIFLVLIAAVNIAVDPLFQYHKPWFGLEPVITNERYQNAGVIKHFDFDNAILGTSLSENFIISEVNNTFGGNSVKLTMYGSSIYNMTYQLELMKKREVKPKIIMCDMSPILFEAPYDTLKNPLPTFLYNYNPFDDGEYLWNISILNDFTYPTVMLNVNHSVPDYDTVFVAEEGAKTGKELALSRYTRPKISDEPESVEAYLDLEKKNLALFTQYFEQMPECEFEFFMAPISMLYWDEQMRLKRVDALEAAYMDVCKTLTSYENVTLYFWTDNEMLDIMSHLDNYVDACHYSREVSSEILRRINDNQGVVTSDNYMSTVDRLFKHIETYNYESYFQSDV